MPFHIPPDHLGLYVHIPFCARKCRYCDFPSQPLDNNRHLIRDYLQALKIEAEMRRRELNRPVHSIYIGGGTPTLLTPEEIAYLWAEVLDPFPRIAEAEVSIEANPGTLTAAHAAVLAALPITRVSLGAQSFHADELAMLGRIHTPAQIAEAVACLRAAGIRQLNLDLMYGLPGQTVARWAETLQQALALAPEHLACYALICEEETPLTREIAAGIFTVPGEEEEMEMAAVTAACLAERGLVAYEVSNAALPDAACRHNLGYWLGRDYLGLGSAAVSALGGVRWRNAEHTATYLQRMTAGLAVVQYVERLSAADRLLERVMLGLRLREGFDLAAAEHDCACRLAALAGDAMAQLCVQGLLAYRDGWLRLTSAGFPVANHVTAVFMLACMEARGQAHEAR